VTSWFTKFVTRSPVVAFYVLVFGVEWLLVVVLSALLCAGTCPLGAWICRRGWKGATCVRIREARCESH